MTVESAVLLGASCLVRSGPGELITDDVTFRVVYSTPADPT